MQINLRYFTGFKIIYIFPLFILGFSEILSGLKRNPFCFSDTKIKLPFSCAAVAKVHNCSKSFAILSCPGNSVGNQKVIAKKGDDVLGYRIVDIFEDVITVQDDKNNEIILHL